VLGFKQDDHWADFKAVAKDFAHGFGDRCDQIGAAAHRFGDHDVGKFGGVGGKSAYCVHQIIELAAKAGSGHFTDIKTLRPKRVGIDQVVCLIVGDQCDVFTLGYVVSSKFSNGGCLTST